jgi:glucose/arabinose dehydrogenase
MSFTRRRWRSLACVLVVVFGSAAPAAAQLKATLIASGFTMPVAFVQDPSDPSVQMVVEQVGHIRVLRNGAVQGADFLDVSALLPPAPLSERGLLGLAFAPDYASSGRFYISYTNTNGDSVISRYLRSGADPLQADASTRFDLMFAPNERFIQQPYDNHKGGNLAFGPDGDLYVAFGDGGAGNDPQNRAQDPGLLLGKMLRIDVGVPDNDPVGYAVPADNPFVGQSGVRPEIWALGLRNPWRWSFDTAGSGGTGALFIGDVGQNAWEEVDYQPPTRGGRNYGWRVFEGLQSNIPAPPPWSSPLSDPIWSYSHAEGAAVIGGFVYRGTALGAAYRGRYFFADNSFSRVWSIGTAVNPATQEATATFPLEHTSELNVVSPSSFGVDSQGEIYVVSYSGAVYRIDPAPGPVPGGCATPDPFGNIGGGTCLGGTWHSPRLSGDFNVDASSDLLFWNYATGQLYAWYMNGVTFTGGNYLSSVASTPAMQVGGVADFTGDGKVDVLMQDYTDGSVHLFVMNGLTGSSEQTIPIAPNTPWRVVATGDLNGDGYPDIIWQRFDVGLTFVWFMKPFNGVATYIGGGYLQDGLGTALTFTGTAWRIAGTGDFNNDGRPDLVWQNDGTGGLKVSYLSGLTVASEEWLGPGVTNPYWKIRAIADFNGDGRPDVIWQHFSTGDLYVWFMSGSSLVNGSYLNPSRVNTAWIMAGPK